MRGLKQAGSGGGGDGIPTTGTSGGVPYYDSNTTAASSATLAANGLVIGGGAGAAPSTTTTGTGVLAVLGTATNGTGELVAVGGAQTITGAKTFTTNSVKIGSAAGPVNNMGALHISSGGTEPNPVALSISAQKWLGFINQFNSNLSVFMYTDSSDNFNLVSNGYANNVSVDAALINLQTVSNNATVVGGDLTMSVAGKALSIKSGTNQRAGNATLVGGTVTIANTTVTANTIVILTIKTPAGTIGTIGYSVIAATSFTITSSSVLDTSVVSYLLIEVP